jgi:cytidylate kinase
MSTLTIKRVNVLPALVTASTFYIVASSDPALAELYFTNTDGTAVRRLQTKEDIQSMIDVSVEEGTQSAPKLEIARDISMTGDATWTVSFDGSGNVTAVMTLADLGNFAGTYGSADGKYLSITANDKGQVTSISEQDITSLEYITGDIKTPSSIYFKTNGTYASDIGKLQWNENFNTFSFGVKTGISLKVGQETLALVTNKSGITIEKGSVVYVTGGRDNGLVVAKALSDSVATCKATCGIAYETIPHNGKGFIQRLGIIEGLDTSGYTLNDKLYLSDDVLGEYTNVAPNKPSLRVEIGFVSKVDPINGTIYVDVKYSQLLDELSNVTLGSVQNKDILQFNSATNLWNNVSYSTAGLIPSSEKGAANGVATLDSNGLVPSNQLPSFVDDVLEYPNLAGLPITGEAAKIYVALDTGSIYRWSGSAYIEISPTAGTVDAAIKLATARSISITGDASWTVNFDGSGNVTAALTLSPTGIVAGEHMVATYNASGRAVSGRSLVEADIPSLSGSKINSEISVNTTGNAGTATKFQTTRTINGTAFDGTSDIVINAVDATARIASSEKGAANGVATLDSNGFIPSNQLPSFVDDVLEYADLATLPGTGLSGKIYVALDTGKIYRWSGSVYIEISGLAGTADAAAKLATARSIAMTGDGAWTVNFDGSANVSSVFSLSASGITAGEYPVATYDYKGRAVSGRALVEADIPSLSGSKINSDISVNTTGNAATATKLNTARNINGTAFDGTGDITINAVDSTARIASSEKGVANGVATLDSNGLIPINQLPSFVDDVLEYADIASLPGTGTSGKIYVALDSGKIYRWSGSVYIEISATAGTADAATKLATVRSIGITGDGTWSVNFDGSSNVSGVLTLADTAIVAGEHIVTTHDSKGRAIGSRALAASDIPALPGSKINSDLSVNTSGNAATAAKLQTARTINGTSFDGTENITINAVDSTARIASSEKGVANGVATLDGSGLIPSNQLPSFVDDVLEYSSLAALPATGNVGKIYVALDSNLVYRWSGTVYVEISSAGTADSATRLATARNIAMTGDGTWSVSFDGSGNVSGVMTLADTAIVAGEHIVTTHDSKGRAIGSRALADSDIPSLPGSKINSSLTVDTSGNSGTATKLQTARTINGTSFDGSANITINAVDVTARIASSEKGVANGVATLDAGGLIPTNQLPSFVDDVLEYVDLAGFPGSGSLGKIYVALDTGSIYRWSGSVYIEISATAGTADAATKLATARTIAMTGDGTWSVSFDGSGNVTSALTLSNTTIVAGEYPVATYDSKGRALSGRALLAADIPSLPGSKINSTLSVDTTGNSATTTKLQTARTINGTSFDGSANITINAVDSTARIASSEKGAANGVATLDGSGLIPTNQLPSFVDDVLEYVNLAGFPGTGVTGKIYVAIDTGKIYRWSGSVYIEISGLAGTADAATKLATARTIAMTGDGTWSVSFDGSGNVSSALTLANTGVTAGESIVATFDAKGRAISTRALAATDIPALPGSKINSAISVDTSGNSATATKLQTARTINGTSFDGSANITINAVDSTARIASSEKGAANGVATLDGSGLIPTNQLPSFVDDVLEYANLAGFPGSGSNGKIYVALDTSKIYRWSGTVYIEISATAGTADAATQLATARTISLSGEATGSVSFNGTADVSIAVTLRAATTSLAGSMSAADKTKLNGIETGARVNPFAYDAVPGSLTANTVYFVKNGASLDIYLSNATANGTTLITLGGGGGTDTSIEPFLFLGNNNG